MNTTAGWTLARPVPFPPPVNAGSGAFELFWGLRPWVWVTKSAPLTLVSCPFPSRACAPPAASESAVDDAWAFRSTLFPLALVPWFGAVEPPSGSIALPQPTLSTSTAEASMIRTWPLSAMPVPEVHSDEV